jgi:hypothetical protein
MVVDVHGNALSYNGSTWSAPSKVDGSNEMVSVSCHGTTFCLAVDLRGDALSYGGSKGWSKPAKIDSYYDMPSVSCPSRTFCVAVDSVGNEMTYNGHAWSAPKNIDAGSA